MMKPDFQAISLKELRAYVLEHREEDEAFYALVDRTEAANPNRVSYPPPKTPEDFEEMTRIIREHLGK